LSCLSLRSSSYYTPPSLIYTLSLHDALPISRAIHFLSFCNSQPLCCGCAECRFSLDVQIAHIERIVLDEVAAWLDEVAHQGGERSEEHTSELQSRENLVCRLLLEKKKKNIAK